MSQVSVTAINLVAYNLAIAVWFAYALLESPARASETILFTPHRWERSLGDLHRPTQDGSLIPMFESMVDRALSRSGTETEIPTPSVEEIALPGSGSRRITFDYPPLTQRAVSKG